MDEENTLGEMLAYGDDSTPLVSRVPDPPPSHNGRITSQGRSTSDSYLQFLERNRREQGRKPAGRP